ncbi:alpha/beta hydrolase [Clostridium beijerinckii]|uniref:Pimeloyl-ACP methyl ester carboxylesterase n=1 Tax=Clostridium beijerinckii TaxID=1520 RepID=A0AAE5EXI9_CLOBE|nr:alpha/beta hydrolase [Clostridium beijerinckii]ALB45656.1 alpha/beta hydrolase [Clostridium beijerinckii NRRL B-598]NRT86804.1 pimeloyl-ACP methyl ester carboxylesterase [Clostridium beijerinckii]NSB14169.1 pimeloyl-ACP methyl ester carboxylesterase [Clostridium beijerinckii]NYC72235.1 pimeloyl-ACP methyl ester carboxylesterase [Clostridium beijerinckii]OOM30521.1 alpha/beta hydrolase family protein [Clostridium beijerinckii]
MYEVKEVEFYSGNLKLAGKLYINKDENKNKSIVVFSHSLGAVKEWLDQKAIDICEGGNHVFLYDFRGHGNSDGVADINLINDIYAAIDYAKSCFEEELPIILAGQCLGGLLSFHAAPKCEDVIAIVGMSIAPEFVITPEKWNFTVDILNSGKGGHTCRFDADSVYEFFNTHDIRDVIKGLNSMPVFLIHYEEDDISPVEELVKIFLHCRCEKNILILDKGQHVSPYLYNSFNKNIVWWINEKKENWYMLK